MNLNSTTIMMFSYILFIISLLNMQSSPQINSVYLALLQHLRNLLSRDNLPTNLYLFKHLKTNLTLPLYALVQERKLAQITSDQQLIIQALAESGLAIVQNNREVMIIDYPTIKIPSSQQQIFREIETLLKQHKKRYSFSDRFDKQFMHLTVYDQDYAFLQQLMSSLSRQVEYTKANLFEDIKQGITRVKKMKSQQKQNGSFNRNGGNYKYSLDKPPQIFIRRAVDSSDEEVSPKKEGKRRYKEAVKEKPSPVKPLFNQQDFPSLT